MEDFSRFSDSTEAIRMVKVLRQTLAEANSNLAKWMVEFDVQINVNTLDIVVTARKPGSNSGFVQTIDVNDALYYKDDVPSLVEEIIDLVFLKLFRDHLYNALHDPLLAATKNVHKMINK
jgi:hypothetical protein